MDEEEDWDTPAKSDPKPSSPPKISNPSTPASDATLKITDGYKYSYEALASPANVEDWVEPSSYGGSRHSNGYSQNSYSRDSNRPRNDRSFENKRFNPMKRNDSFSNDRSPKSFGRPNAVAKDSFSKDRSPRNPGRPMPSAAEAWDAMNSSNNQTNGSWQANVNTPINNPAEEDWDAPAAATPSYKPLPAPPTNNIPPYNPNSSFNNSRHSFSKSNNSVSAVPAAAAAEEDWDAPVGSSSNSNRAPPPSDLPMFKPSSNSSSNRPLDSPPRQEARRSKVVEEENWDEPSGVSSSKSNQSPVDDIPLFRPRPPPSSSNTSLNDVNLSKSNADEENWDEPGESNKKNSVPDTDIPLFRPDKSRAADDVERNKSAHNLEESWDDEAPEQSNGGASDIPLFRPAGGSSEQTSGIDAINKSYENNALTNKFPKARGFGGGGNDGFDPFTRAPRDSNRSAPYERGFGGGGRGGRGGRDFRGGRGGRRDFRDDRGDRGFRDRDGRNSPYQSSFNSRDNRDNSRGKGGGGGWGRGRPDRGFQNDFNKSRNNDRSFNSPSSNNSFNNSSTAVEEDWDEPTGFKSKPAESISNSPPAAPVQRQAVEEESWD